MPPSTPPSSAEPSSTLLDRVQTFISENKRAVLLGTAAVIVAGGVAYYTSTSSPGPSRKGKQDKGKGKKSKDASSKGDGQKGDSPIIEEVAPKPEEKDLGTYTEEEIKAMPTEKRKELANEFKGKGNTEYGRRNFDAASKLYTSAIEISPTPEPVFYSNRAACYINMTPPMYDLVVIDCDSALSLDPNYVKALNRRALALEGLQRYEEALRDFTAATILDKFSNKAAAESIERVIKIISNEKAAKIFQDREPRLPSHTFISAYFAAFRPRPLPTLPENASTGDNTLLLGLQALEAPDYAHALTLINESLEQGITWDEGRAEALNLRGTFKFLMGDVDGAKADLLESLNLFPSFTQSLVKIASVYMEQGDPKMAFECFDKAIAQNPDDPDIYYHRGQVLFIMNEFKDAAENYTQSTKLDDQFVFSHIQLAVAQYKDGNIGNSMATFRRTLKAFPQRSEPHNYYGELLLDQQRFEEAVEKFERAIELEKTKTPPNVLPLVNKGLALFQWKNDITAAETCCDEALVIDPECEAAVTTLAQLSLQQGKLERAVEMFSRQSELARSELELLNALTYQYASSAQVEFMKNYPHMAAQLRDIATGVM